MAKIPAAVRVLPMDSTELEFNGASAEGVQRDFFVQDLPKRRGKYLYRKQGLRTPPGTVVLFQYQNHVIASAILDRIERFPKPKGDYSGAFHFSAPSIHIFYPVSSDQMKKIWPKDFKGFRRAKLSLDPEAYPVFEQQLTDPAPEAYDLEAPPADRVEVKELRIVRDTQMTNCVKKLHNYKCQICGYTIHLSGGSRYAEGHHVQPLGKHHNGPDRMDNIICLCPNHHAACDMGAIRIFSAELRGVAQHHISQRYIDYHNDKIFPGRGSSAKSH